MPALLSGEPAPVDGALPADAVAEVSAAAAAAAGTAGSATAVVPRAGEDAFGLYLHVPFCAVRCGYCDFNTYTLPELGDGSTGRGAMADYLDAATGELDLMARVLPQRPSVTTVFVGGGTPTMLGAATLAELLRRARDRHPFSDDVEVSVEANPDTVDETDLVALAAAGVTRVSLGMQSTVPHVLAALDRTHDPENVSRAVSAARVAGLDVSLDLIYGTPGESHRDWGRSLADVVDLCVDHVSAYALTVEPGTRLHGRVRRGELADVDADDQADRYELADDRLGAAGLSWYEISNWARDERHQCRHNIGYWSGRPWWGIGPGAHSHVAGVRWWNVKHPSRYARALAEGASPAAAREVLTPRQRYEEGVMLGVRLSRGLPISRLDERGAAAVSDLVGDGLVQAAPVAERHRVVLTRRGRLLADLVVGRLLT